jgi:hypothetical protein
VKKGKGIESEKKQLETELAEARAQIAASGDGSREEAIAAAAALSAAKADAASEAKAAEEAAEARRRAEARAADADDKLRCVLYTGPHTTALAWWTPILKDFCRRLSPPTTRFQSPPSAPFNAN